MLTTFKLYFDIAVGLLIVGLVVFAGWQYDQRKLTDAKMDRLGDQLTATQGVLTQLQQGQAADTAAIQSMAASQALVAQHGSVVRQRVVTMGKNDDKVRTWLDTLLPADGCMLDDTCPGRAVANPPVGGASAALH